MKTKNKKTKLISLWNEVASEFSNSGALYWNELGTKLVQFSNIQSEDKILDIGIGRGSSLFPIIELISEKGSVVGIDIADKMVFLTQQEISKRKSLNVEVRQMDAEYLEFQDEFFDKIISGFSIGNLIETENGLSDVVRVLKTKGQLSFSTWGAQEEQGWLSEIVGRYINIKSPSNGIKFNDLESITKVLMEYGMGNFRTLQESIIVKYRNKDDWWKEMNSNAFKGIINLINQMGEFSLAKFKKEVFYKLEDFRVDGYLVFNMKVIYIVSEKI